MAGKHLRLHLEYMKVAINTAMQYKANFIIQVVSMALNDLVWVIFWMLFFNKFKNAGSWEFGDMLMLYSVLTMAYGIAGIFFGNRGKIASIISEGRLDYYLTLPKNILYHMMISRTSWYDLGDLIFGLIIAVIVIPIVKWPLMILLVFMSTIIFLSFMIIAGSITFYTGSSHALESTMGSSIVSLASYPLDIFHGFTKFVILVIIPSGFISGVPVELLKQFNIEWFLMMIGFTLAIFILALILFYKGLKKYESGNLLYVRT